MPLVECHFAKSGCLCWLQRVHEGRQPTASTVPPGEQGLAGTEAVEVRPGKAMVKGFTGVSVLPYG